ncbi:heme exporter protein CcmB [Litorivicinus lipolyticus]|uniref:Heme exporter protein B n=1 Tax=Litorivicinus lipolyticus TaxID=418701 RepID=A0A5Q2QGA3_9GAMM|nr:heme exporter protein CcmB [Litorivicinus lipolyticus]QGG80035.1 heme exporter protein CcmB [Litorivicinus lipolyticus]
MSRLLQCVGRDLKLMWADAGQSLRPVMFFALVGVSFPLGLGANNALLASIAPGLVWVAALLAVLLALDGLFREDLDDGTLEQWLLSDLALPLTVLLRVLTLWLGAVAPIVVLGPLVALAFGLGADAAGVLGLTLLVGTPTCLLLGSLGAALLAAARGGGSLLGLLVLPLFVPVLVFGAGASTAFAGGVDVTGQLALMGAMLAASVALVPIAVAAALRIVTGG